MNALGFIEVPFLSVAAVVADAAAKAARVSMLGFEATGNENILIRHGGGGVSDVEAALAAADETETRLGTSAIVQAIARPEEAMIAMIHFPNANNLSGPSPAPVPHCSSSGVFTRIGLNVAEWSPMCRPDSKRMRKPNPNGHRSLW
jgi:microcompartment protein CcmL/EutN